jgi:hypothetical protein
VAGRYQLVPGRIDTAGVAVEGVWRIDTFTGRTWWGQPHTYAVMVGTNLTTVNIIGWEDIQEDPFGAWQTMQSRVNAIQSEVKAIQSAVKSTK